MTLPRLIIVRHGDTAWTDSHQHTGRTDLPLNERGEQSAQRLRSRLAGIHVAQVFTSPLIRAAQTCELAGFAERAVNDPDLVEWDYGEYEGKTTAEIRDGRPDWDLFRDGCPGGETLDAVAARADRFVKRVRAVEADVLAFSSGHFLRVLAARWLGLPGAAGRGFYLGTAAVSVLGYEHNANEPVVRLWNEQDTERG